MKRLITLCIEMCFATISPAQSNVFPSNGNVGIGILNPVYNLQVLGNTGTVAKFESTVGGAAIQIISSGGGKAWSIGDFVEVNGALSIGYNLTDNRSGILISGNGNVGIGTTSPTSKLSVNGNIRAKEIKVEASNWPDYVFAPDYQVTSLAELQKYIKANHHLPDMPDAKEVRTDGVALGEMIKLQQKKIEELTLHLIEKNNDIIILKEQVAKINIILNQTQNK